MFISRSKGTKYTNTPLSHKSVILHFGMKNHTKVDMVFDNFVPLHCVMLNNYTMTASKGDFFISANSVYNVSEEEYERIELLLNATKAFARATHQCVYVIDYFQKGFLYVSDDIEMLCGEPVEKVQEFGYDLYLKHVPEEEVRMLLEINREGFEMANTIEPEERMQYTISYDFHLINGKKKQLINHTLTPIMMTRDGRIWLALCTIAPSTKNTPGNVVLKKAGESWYHAYSLTKHQWEVKEAVKLTEMERDILRLSSQGYTMDEIATQLCKSIDTIKTYKKRLFAKLEVRSIAEALSYATNYKLL